ncbi:Spindle and kinetochore-associated protein 1 [Lamellibrachia satsuma]|nr:Spindle and kinetochore-associated protein 1 [Lamellibrachia satsuma]
MKGRILYDSLNSTIDELNQVFSSKYKILSTPKSGQSDNTRNKIQTYKEQETKDTKGLFFVVESDLKTFGRLKMDNTGRTHLTILRHCGRIREIRGNGLTRYTLCT